MPNNYHQHGETVSTTGASYSGKDHPVVVVILNVSDVGSSFVGLVVYIFFLSRSVLHPIMESCMTHEI